MGFMAIRTVFHNRRMFPQERAAAFRVATQAIFVDGALNELAGIGRAMRIMATRARHLALAIGHMGRPLQLCAAHWMALQAQFWLRLFHAMVLRKWCVEPGVR